MFWFDLNIVHAAIVYKLLATARCLPTNRPRHNVIGLSSQKYMNSATLSVSRTQNAIYQRSAWLTSRLKTTQPDSWLMTMPIKGSRT